MLYEFLAANHDALVERCKEKVAKRSAPKATPEELQFGIPLFLGQLIKTLRLEQTPEPLRAKKVSGGADGIPEVSEIGVAAARHGQELLKHGFTVEQVVHDYGDLCQAITDLAEERHAAISTDEFRTLNRCLDNGIADAVTEFGYQRELAIKDVHEQELNQQLGALAHELRNHLNSATLAVAAIKAGNVGIGGATGAVLDRSLIGLRNLIDRSLASARMNAGTATGHELVGLADLVAEIKITASLEAQTRGCRFSVPVVDGQLAVDADRDLLSAAIGNLLQNAFKFTHRNSEVTLSARAEGERIYIEVHDHCGGLPPGDSEDLFLPFIQRGADRTGSGLGLSISRRSVEANNGVLSVRDIPGTGCVFTIDLPRRELPPTVA